MKLREMLKEEKGNHQYPARWTKITASLEEERQATDIVVGFGVKNDYSMTLAIKGTARCNEVEWRNGMRNLLVKRLFGELFSETETHINRAITAVYAEDAEEALKCLHDAIGTLKAS